ncbi:hypothetical protein EGH24_03845 [Halonotius terrestris]|uniref:HEAT repeat-containing protein n=1 Tax=Halonotius terrestris TaxID=2487750 RepID=A0A8J8TCW1_9EURY|nr:HEAT repeat domain-containing protein [Halonotius terrestris]TQQ82594.1 hypothetical protein EGH24_03845 [Halonotius terrestris]
MPSDPSATDPACCLCGDAVSWAPTPGTPDDTTATPASGQSAPPSDDAAITFARPQRRPRSAVPNPVCRSCAEAAETTDGEPIDGLPTAPPADDEFELTPYADGPNPVIVDGARCWRTGTADCWQLSREAVACDSVREFIRRHTDSDGAAIEWFAPDPTGLPLQIRMEPDSAPGLTAFFEQFGPATAFRVDFAAAATPSAPNDCPLVDPHRVPTAEVAPDAPPTFEATTLESEPRRLRFQLPAIKQVRVVEEPSRPSLDEQEPAVRVSHYRTLAETAPGLVNPADIEPLLTASAPRVRFDAVRTFRTLLTAEPSAGLSAVDSLTDRLDDRQLTALTAVRCLLRIAEEYPAAVADSTPAVSDVVDSGSALLDTAATRLLLYIAEHDPAAALDATPALASLLSPTPTRPRRQALATVGVLAEPYPEEIRPLVPQLCSLLRTDDTQYRISSTAALGRVTAEYPDAATPAVPTLLDQLTAADAELRGNAVGVLGDIARGFPMDIAPYTEEIGPLLGDEDPTVRSNTAGTLARVANDDPRHVLPYVPALIDLLDDSWTRSRVHACWALGYCGDSDATAALSDIRHTDPSEAVRDRAAWALDRIE